MNEYNLLSSEQVYLKLKLAGVGSRFAACFIDGIFQSLICMPIVFLIIGIYEFQYTKVVLSMPGLWKWWLIAILILISFTILYGYFIFFETIWNGQTPGKRFIKLRVVRDNGASVTFIQVLIRNILRMLDALPSGYAIGIIAVLISKKNQRLGDMAAGTVVIREDSGDAPTPANYEIRETSWSGIARLHMHEISEADFAVLKKYLQCRKTIKRDDLLVMERKLVAFFSRKLALKPEETGNPEEFLTQVAAMYQHR